MRKLRWIFCGVLVVWATVELAATNRPGAARSPSAAVGGTVAAAASQAGPEMSLRRGLVSLRIQLGLKDKQNTPWDGSITAGSGRVLKMEIWRRGMQDSVEGNSWKVSTRPAPRFASRAARGKTFPPTENGVIVTLDGVHDASEITVSTKQGDFSFKLSDVPYGKRLLALDGQADVSRIPVSYQLTGSGTEEDYPAAAAAPDGTVWVSYVAFSHSKDFAKRYSFGPEEPNELPPLDEPTGGDQLLVMRSSGNQWSRPMPVTPGGEDLYKTAIAVDGRGRPWVFWSQQVDGNFDLYASSLEGDSWTKPQRLTTDPEPDIEPVAATDSKGRVWLAWQAFRLDNFDILAIRQGEDGLFGETSPMAVSSDPANEWHPAIAASSSSLKGGDVAIAWDTYANGNYDVFYRVAKAGGELGKAVAVAASLREEVHPAVTYDGSGKLWVAWEEGPERWGKDFGALVKDEGSPLYGGGARSVYVKCFQAEQAFEPADDLIATIAGRRPGGGQKNEGGQGRGRAQERRTGAGVPISLPRLATDSAGRVWLAYRARSPLFWSGVGTAWFEYLTCYNGNQWLSPIYVHNSDNILDNRPALVSLAEGRMLLVCSSDGRRDVSGFRQAEAKTDKPGKADPVNNDIFASAFGLQTVPARAAKLNGIAAESPAGPVGRAEDEAVRRCRSYRLEVGGKSLRLMRGEFHRHTELSSDGGGDGGLVDMYRYALDAADMDWIGNGDHDNGGGREYSWWIIQKTADVYKVGRKFTPVYAYERSVSYPDGHRNVIFPVRGIRTLPRFGKPGTGSDDQQPAHTPDTLLLYRYLEQFDGLCASHTSGTDMGTDWRDNNPQVEPVVEIYQGCRQNYEEPGAPRAPKADDAIGGWRPNGFVWNALAKGYRLGFQSSSDHVSTHISYCSVWAEEPTREAIFKALKARHVFGATDDIIADVRCGDHMMGDEFLCEDGQSPTFAVKLVGTGPWRRVDIVKDNAYVYNVKPGKPSREVDFTWTDMAPKKAGTSYYYIRGEQEDGQLVWVSPMWITFQRSKL